MLKLTRMLAVTSLLLPLLLAACSVAPAPGSADAEGSLLASIGGMADKDTANKDLYYRLVCGQIAVRGNLTADQKAVTFAGAAIAEGASCALEVRLDPATAAAAPYANFTWYASKADKSADVGLFYGSDLQKVTGRVLTLKLYVLYHDPSQAPSNGTVTGTVTATAVATATATGTATSVGTGVGSGGQASGCVNYTSNVCTDRTSLSLLWSKNYLVARVIGRKAGGTGDKVTLLVAGGSGLGLYEKGTLSRDDLNSSLKPTRSIQVVAEPTYSWYKPEAEAQILKLAFDDDVVSGKNLAAYRAADADLTDVVILHIDQVWVHGLHLVDQATLDAEGTASWLAVMKATKAGESDHQFVVTSKTKYLQPTAAQGSVGGKATFFDPSGLVLDLMSGSGSNRWATYALAGDPLVPGCQAAQSYYLQDLSFRDLNALQVTDATLDGCAYPQDKFNAAWLGPNWSLSGTYFAWEWIPVVK